MEKETLEFMMDNLREFVASAIIGTGVGYVSNRSRNKNKLVDKPEISKIGYSTLLTFLGDPIRVGLGASFTRATKGNLGSILGWYAGFHLGKILNKGVGKLYESRVIPCFGEAVNRGLGTLYKSEERKDIV